MRIGIDFDNTLICYDEVFQAIAQSWGLSVSGAPASKEEIRACARATSEGDLTWQRMQALAYGPKILDAKPAPGAREFLEECAERQIPLRLISHKTEFAAQDCTRTNLRTAALSWMAAHGFLQPQGPLASAHCLFLDTRAEKIARIRAESCTHFIDDLPEVFEDPQFPGEVSKLLYCPLGGVRSDGMLVCTSWREIAGHLIV